MDYVINDLYDSKPSFTDLNIKYSILDIFQKLEIGLVIEDIRIDKVDSDDENETTAPDNSMDYDESGIFSTAISITNSDLSVAGKKRKCVTGWCAEFKFEAKANQSRLIHNESVFRFLKSMANGRILWLCMGKLVNGQLCAGKIETMKDQNNLIANIITKHGPQCHDKVVRILLDCDESQMKKLSELHKKK